MQRLSRLELQPGTKLRWPVYDTNGKLLLQKGHLLSSVQQIEQLIARGLYRNGSEQSRLEVNSEQVAITLSERMELLRNRLKQLLRQLNIATEKQPLLLQRVRNLALELRDVCLIDSDAAIAAIHLFLHGEYSIDHPLHAAFLVELLGEQAGLREDERLSMVCAALTHDMGIITLQQAELDRQDKPLTPAQWQRVKQHPLVGEQQLRRLGVRDPIWLGSVRWHHERLDGSGYPDQLNEQDHPIPIHARILAIADIYSAMVRPRPHRDAIESRETLRTLFLERGKRIDEALANRLVTTFGIYPPGTLLQLDSGEIAVVARRGERANEPIIYRVIGRSGQPLPTPQLAAVTQISKTVSVQRYRSILPMIERIYCELARQSRD